MDMKFFSGNTLYTLAGAKVNRTLSLMWKLRLKKDLFYNHLMVSGISPADVVKVLSHPKPSGKELAATVPHNSEEKMKLPRHLSEDNINAEYASRYLDVDKAWLELLNIAVEWGEKLPAQAAMPSVIKEDEEEGEKEAKKLDRYDFRHIRNIYNVINYNTLSYELNKTFKEYLMEENYQIEVGAMFPGAPEHAMPINFLLTKDGKRVAILLLEWRKAKRYSVQETEALCKENGVEVLKFYFNCENEKGYVLERIRKAFN